MNRPIFPIKIQSIKGDGLMLNLQLLSLVQKNWLFVGSEWAGKRVVVIQTLLGTAKLNGLNPIEWLKETLEKLPTWPNIIGK